MHSAGQNGADTESIDRRTFLNGSDVVSDVDLEHNRGCRAVRLPQGPQCAVGLIKEITMHSSVVPPI
jgi:hypothetical protein